MFPCETILESTGKACGHPLNLHNPCTATIGSGKKARVCDCPAFSPTDLRDRVAGLTDNANPRAAIAAAIANGPKA